MKRELRMILGLFLVMLGAQTAVADTDPKTRSEQLFEQLAKMRDAVIALQESLSQKPSSLKVNARDYFEWNKKFSEEVERETKIFLGDLEQHVVSVMKPLVDEYEEILNSASGLSPEQFEALKAAQKNKINLAIPNIAAGYQAIYSKMIVALYGWLPKVKILENVTRTSEDNALVRMFTGPYCGDCRQTYLRYSVSRLNGHDAKNYELKYVVFLKQFFHEFGALASDERANAWLFPGNKPFVYSLIEGRAGFGALTWGKIRSIEDLQNTIGDNFSFFDAYVMPELKKDCRSQVCLTLKETDLREVLDSIGTTIAQPLIIKFTDGSDTRIPAPFIDLSPYVAKGYDHSADHRDRDYWQLQEDPANVLPGMLSEVANDPTLPFDTDM